MAKREGRRRHITTKTWPATFDWKLEKDSSESWGPRWLLLWHSPRRWLLAPKNGSAPFAGPSSGDSCEQSSFLPESGPALSF